MSQFEKRSPIVAGAHLTNNEEPARAHSNVDTNSIRLGIVRRVHADSATMDVHLIGNADLIVPEVHIHFPYVGPAGFIGTLPEVGCLVVLADTPHGLVPLSYQIPQKENALNYNMMEDFPASVSDPLQEPFRVRPSVYRYLRPGETRIASSTNSELFLNEDDRRCCA